MRRRIKLWSVAKWLGAGAAAIVFVVWVASGWVRVGWNMPAGASVVVGSGAVGVFALNGPGAFFYAEGTEIDWLPGVSVEAQAFEIGLLPSASSLAGRGRAIVAPLWIPLVLLVSMTAAAWRYEVLARRRAVSGACKKCGYDRSGIGVEAVCPECGTVPRG